MSRAHEFDSRGHCTACGMRDEEGWPGRHNPCPLGSLANKLEQTKRRRAKAKANELAKLEATIEKERGVN